MHLNAFLSCSTCNSYSLVFYLCLLLFTCVYIRFHSYSTLTRIYSHSPLTRIHSSSLALYSCLLYFTRVLLVFTFPLVFYSYSLVFPLFNFCSTHVLLVFTLIDSCSTRVHPNSLVFIGVHWCSR